MHVHRYQIINVTISGVFVPLYLFYKHWRVRSPFLREYRYAEELKSVPV